MPSCEDVRLTDLARDCLVRVPTRDKNQCVPAVLLQCSTFYEYAALLVNLPGWFPVLQLHLAHRVGIMPKKKQLVLAEDCAGLGPLFESCKFLGIFDRVPANKYTLVLFKSRWQSLIVYICLPIQGVISEVGWLALEGILCLWESAQAFEEACQVAQTRAPIQWCNEGKGYPASNNYSHPKSVLSITNQTWISFTLIEGSSTKAYVSWSTSSQQDVPASHLVQ